MNDILVLFSISLKKRWGCCREKYGGVQVDDKWEEQSASWETWGAGESRSGGVLGGETKDAGQRTNNTYKKCCVYRLFTTNVPHISSIVAFDQARGASSSRPKSGNKRVLRRILATGITLADRVLNALLYTANDLN